MKSKSKDYGRLKKQETLECKVEYGITVLKEV
jgi:hypothetical protein